jgi:hypothetical protein
MRTSFFLAVFVTLCLARVVAASGISSEGPAEEAPAELQQFGQFVGTWKCTSFSRDRERVWQPNPWENTWSWYWVLDGHAIQDVWEASPDSPPGWNAGTNLRVYDPRTKRWKMAWTTTLTNSFSFYEAEYVDGEMVMQGDIPEHGQRPGHHARITFYGITKTAFDWKYEAALGGQEDVYAEQARLQCRRSDG